MAVLSITQSYSVTIDGQTFSGGSTTAATVTVAGETIVDRTYSVTTATIQELLRLGSNTDDDLADFVFLFVLSDVAAEMRVQTDTDDDGSGARQGFAIQLAAGIPLMLTGGDASRADTLVDSTIVPNVGWATGTVDVIEAIDYYQTSGGAGKVRVVAIR